MKKLNAFLFMFIFLFAIMTSCKKEATCGEQFDFATEVGEEFDALTDAAISYSLDPTEKNCNTFKKSAENYINAAEKLQPCAEAVGQGTEFKSSIKEAEDSLQDLNCN